MMLNATSSEWTNNIRLFDARSKEGFYGDRIRTSLHREHEAFAGFSSNCQGCGCGRWFGSVRLSGGR